MLLDWNIETTDIREQFPLRQEDTLALAFEAGIEHPALNGVMHIMSSDFLVNTSNTNLPKFVLQAKYTQAIQDPRTIEKLELERRYWQLKGVPWQLVTEQDIPKIVFQNISWLYPAQRDELSDEVIIDRQKFYSHQFQQHPNKTIIEIAKKLDVEYNLAVGESLLESLSLIGCSGSGKSTTLNRILATYPQVIFHEKYNFTQIVYLKLDCPHDGSLKNLCYHFFRAIDEV